MSARPLDSQSFKTINARFDSTCFECGEAIWEGDRIDYNPNGLRGQKVRHNDCTDIARKRNAERAAVVEADARREREIVRAKEQRELDQEAEEQMERDLSTEDIRGLLDENERFFNWYRQNPPTMDYMVEWSRAQAEHQRYREQTERLEILMAEREFDRMADEYGNADSEREREIERANQAIIDEEGDNPWYR